MQRTQPVQFRRKHQMLTSLVAAVIAWGVAGAHAQTYPSRIIRIVIPFAAGGLVDATARLIQPALERALGQSIIIDNRPAATGMIGTDAVVKSAPDGYMLLMVASTHTVTPATNHKLPYDIERDLAPIVIVAKNPILFVINSKVPAKTLSEFIALAKAEPSKFNYATPGAASQAHLVSELFSQRAGIKMQHVPYRGGGPAVLATVAGETQFAALSTQVSLPHIEAGSLRPLAVGSLVRDPQFPDLPSVAESGFPGFEAIQWVGMLAAAGTPREIVDRLNAEVNRVIRDPDLVAKLSTQGMSPAGGTPDDFKRVVAAEVKQWTEVARAAKIEAE